MTVSHELFEQVRQRAQGACEYCGVTEVLTGGLLTIDHYQPQARSGSDELENLLYCCFRCNVYKGDYWPVAPEQSALWHPLREPFTAHFREHDNGTLEPLTPTGQLIVSQLHLNRPALVAHRVFRRSQGAPGRPLDTHFALLREYARLQRQFAWMAEQYGSLLEQHLRLLEGRIESEE